MTVNPDYTPYVDLTLYDKSPTDILAAGVSTLQARMADWQPTATNVEMMLLEAIAIEVGETLFTLNRLPSNLLRRVLLLYGVVQYPGSPPSVNITFTAQDDTGYVVPGGTEVSILLPTGDYMSFYTELDLTIPALMTTGTVSASATEYTAIANGISIGTVVEMVDSVTGVIAAETATIVGGGEPPETETEFLQRGTQRLQRLVDTLVIPAHFTQAALENPLVVRANTLDNWDGSGGAPGDDPGYVTVVVYGDAAPLSTYEKGILQADLEARAAAHLEIVVIDPTVTDVDVTVSVKVSPIYTEAHVLDAVEARLIEYLSPNTWPWTGTVRRNELISVIDQVTGVDYVDTLTLPAADINITSGSALVRADTITVTAV